MLIIFLVLLVITKMRFSLFVFSTKESKYPRDKPCCLGNNPFELSCALFELKTKAQFSGQTILKMTKVRQKH